MARKPIWAVTRLRSMSAHGWRSTQSASKAQPLQACLVSCARNPPSLQNPVSCLRPSNSAAAAVAVFRAPPPPPFKKKETRSAPLALALTPKSSFAAAFRLAHAALAAPPRRRRHRSAAAFDRAATAAASPRHDALAGNPITLTRFKSSPIRSLNPSTPQSLRRSETYRWPYSAGLACCMLHVACRMSHGACRMSHVACCCMLHVACRADSPFRLLLSDWLS